MDTIRAIDTLRGGPKVAMAMVGISLTVALFAPLITPHDPIAGNLQVQEQPPAFMEGGSFEYVLGTDRQGRDILSRVMGGARVSLSVAALSILVGGGIGTFLGLLAGYFGGWVDVVIMRVVDLMLAFPSLLIALVLAVTLGPSFWVIVSVVSLVLWSRYARLVRGEVLSLKEKEFVALARIAGCSPGRIMFSHLLPNLMSSIVVLSTLQVGFVIVVEASLSFLGAGISEPTPTWGRMLAEGRAFLETSWWISVFPGLAVMMVVLSFNIFGDWLRDILDPKLRQL